MKIVIDKEFEEFLPAGTDAEHQELEASLIEDGCRDPLVLWGDILVDGHRRYQICKAKKIKFETVKREFENRDAVLLWMASNQTARRNLNPEQISYYRGKEYNLTKKAHGDLKNTKSPSNSPSGKFYHLGEKTAEAIAEKHGVSEKTVRNDAAFAAAVDASPDKAEILSGKSEKTKSEIVKSAPKLCPKCARVGVVKDCPQCVAIREKIKSESKPKKEPKEVKDETIVEVESICREIDQINQRLEKIKLVPISYSLHFPTIIPKLKEVREILWQGRAIHDDPYCKGKGEKNGEKCKICRGTGKVIKSVSTSGIRAVGHAGDAA